jgi:hypothetical protein
MALLLPTNLCLFGFRDPSSEFTTVKLKECLLARNLQVTQEEEMLQVRWGKSGPTFFVKIVRGTIIETMLRGHVKRRKKLNSWITGCDAAVEISFDDLDEVLDEINTLIKVQSTIQQATQGIGFNSWNFKMWPPED